MGTQRGIVLRDGTEISCPGQKRLLQDQHALTGKKELQCGLVNRDVICGITVTKASQCCRGHAMVLNKRCIPPLPFAELEVNSTSGLEEPSGKVCETANATARI